MASKALINLSQDRQLTLDFIKVVSSQLKVGSGSASEQASAAMICATQMIADGITLAELRQRFHVYPDRLEFRAEYIHAELERRGWKWTWEKDGEDGKEACLKATKDGETHRVSFTIEQARKKGIVRQGSAWHTDPALMLRARCITRFATMWCPSIGAGMQDDAEAQGSSEVDVAETVNVAYEVKEETPAKPESPPEPPLEKKPITKSSLVVDLSLPKRAFTSFAKEPHINTIEELCNLTYDDLVGREGMGVGTADKVVEILHEYNFSLAVPPDDDTPDVQPHKPDSDQPSSDSEHGQAIAEIREICTYEAETKQLAIDKIKELWPDKTSLFDLDAVQAHLLLVFIYAHKAGFVDKFPGVMKVIMDDPHPITRARSNIQQLKDRIKN